MIRVRQFILLYLTTLSQLNMLHNLQRNGYCEMRTMRKEAAVAYFFSIIPAFAGWTVGSH